MKRFDREHRVLRVGDGLPLGYLPHQPFATLREGDDRRSGARPSWLAITVGWPASMTPRMSWSYPGRFQ